MVQTSMNMNNEDAGMESMITTFNTVVMLLLVGTLSRVHHKGLHHGYTAVTETASDNLGKHRCYVIEFIIEQQPRQEVTLIVPLPNCQQ